MAATAGPASLAPLQEPGEHEPYFCPGCRSLLENAFQTKLPSRPSLAVGETRRSLRSVIEGMDRNCTFCIMIATALNPKAIDRNVADGTWGLDTHIVTISGDGRERAGRDSNDPGTQLWHWGLTIGPGGPPFEHLGGYSVEADKGLLNRPCQCYYCFVFPWITHANLL